MQYLQQEVDALRDKLQDSVRQTSTLEAEAGFLKQQLCEAKAEARQDKQASELKVQDCQMELARKSTLLEQATVRSRRAAEEATVAQQDLSTAKQQLQRVELERDAAQQQLQGLHRELSKLRAQHADFEQEVRRLQLQVQQQQRQEQRLQEQLARERQQQQEEGAATRASIEQHRIELRRCVVCVVTRCKSGLLSVPQRRSTTRQACMRRQLGLAPPPLAPVVPESGRTWAATPGYLQSCCCCCCCGFCAVCPRTREQAK